MTTESVDLGRALAAQREARSELLAVRSALMTARARVEAADAAYKSATDDAQRAQDFFNDALMGACE
jgi:multidrug resistance efflux pump